jgi:glycerophosphoryl diester phosphodiesterase
MLAVHGHRGARAVLPENTLEGFKYAISAGADYIEMDVAITRDDVPVISHDPVLRSGHVIRELTSAELMRADPTVPSLENVLALSGIRFNIEMKSYPDAPQFTPPPERCAELLLGAIRKQGAAARAMVESFDFRVLRAMRRIAPDMRLAALVEQGDPDFVATARQAEAEIIAPEFHMVTVEKVEAAHAAGLEVITWTANLPSEWKRLEDAGVDAIITDHPAGLRAWLQTRGIKLT